MIENGVVGAWDAHFVEFKDREIIQRLKWDENYPHYVGVPGMNAIAKYLSHDLRITLGTRVQSIHKDNGKWYLEDDQGNARGKYDWVILAIPAQQASELIPTSIPFYSKISTVKMRGCFSLMLGFEQALPLKFDAALVHGEDISWISVNSSKPARNEPFCLLVHSTNQWADEHIDDNWDQVM